MLFEEDARREDTSNRWKTFEIYPSFPFPQFTSGSAPAALSACVFRGTVSRSTPWCGYPWPCDAGCSPSAPPSSPTPPSAGRSAGRCSVPEPHNTGL